MMPMTRPTRPMPTPNQNALDHANGNASFMGGPAGMPEATIPENPGMMPGILPGGATGDDQMSRAMQAIQGIQTATGAPQMPRQRMLR